MSNLRTALALFLLRRCAGFDAEWYLRQNPDVASAGADPYAHYIHFGAFEGRRPHPQTRLRSSPTELALLARRGINPVLRETYGTIAMLFARKPPSGLRPVAQQGYGDTQPAAASTVPTISSQLDWSSAAASWQALRQSSALDLLQDGRLRVTAVIPCFNSARYIAERLKSVLWQRWPIAELIILDDASTDDTLQVLKALDAETGRALPVRTNVCNSGSPFAQWQSLLPHCTGDLVWIAEADDVAHPDFLATVAPAFQNSHVGVAYANSLRIDSEGIVLCRDTREWLPASIRSQWQSAFVVDGRDFAARYLSVQNCIPNVSGVVFRRGILAAALARSQERLARLRLAGDWQVYAECLHDSDVFFTPEVLNASRYHPTSHTFNFDRIQHLIEVAQVQSDVIRAFGAGEGKVDEATQHLTALARHLKLSDVETLADAHPPLRALLAKRGDQ